MVLMGVTGKGKVELTIDTVMLTGRVPSISLVTACYFRPGRMWGRKTRWSGGKGAPRQRWSKRKASPAPITARDVN